MSSSQLSLVRGVCARAGLNVVGVGSGERGRGGVLKELIDGLTPVGVGGPANPVPPLAVDDLRNALATTDAQLVLLAAPGDFAAAPTSAEADAAVLAETVKRGIKILTFEPLPASVLQLGTAGVMSGFGGGGDGAGNGMSGGDEWARFIPSMRETRVLRDVADLAESFGQVQSVCLRMVGRSCHGSVGARLYDAAALLVSMLGMPDQAYATYVGRLGWGGTLGGNNGGGGGGFARGLRPLPGDSLRGLSGDVSATLRYADGRAAAVFVSDRAGEFSRSITLVGERGTLTITDAGLRWIDEGGREIDAPRPDETLPADGAGETDPAEELIAREVRTAIDPSTASGGGAPLVPIDAVRVLAVAGAVLLSSRTGEVESPSTVLRMAGVG